MARWNMKTKTMMALGAISALTLAAPGNVIPPASAAPWLAPAPQERLAADWVKDIARQFRKERVKEVFMNTPFGSPQASILGLLNESAMALKEGEIQYAKDLINHAVGLLDDGVENGWYSRRDIEPIKGLIISRATEGIKEAKKSQARSSKRSRRGDGGYQSTKGFDEPLFGGKDDYDLYGEEGERWTGYTRNRPFGITERLEGSGPRPQDRDREQRSSMRRSRGDQERYADEGRSERHRGQGWREEDQERSRSISRERSRRGSGSSEYAQMRQRDRRQDPWDHDWDRLGPQERSRMSALEQDDRQRINRTGAMRPRPSHDYEDEGRFSREERERQSRTSQRMSRDDEDSSRYGESRTRRSNRWTEER